MIAVRRRSYGGPIGASQPIFVDGSWLNELRRLDGARVFEIGRGIGSSIMALAEQGSDVTGIDAVLELPRVRLPRFCGYRSQHRGPLGRSSPF